MVLPPSPGFWFEGSILTQREPFLATALSKWISSPVFPLLTLTTVYILYYLKVPSLLKLVLNYSLWKPTCGGLSPTHMGPWYLPHLCFSWSRGQPEESHSNILLPKWKWNFFGMAFIVMMPGVHHNQYYKGNTKGSNKDLPFIVKHDLGVSTFCVYKMTRFTL